MNRRRRLQRLLGDCVLIKVDEERRTSLGGIVLPTEVPARTGTVMLVGPGRHYPDRYVATDVKVGERVAFFIASAQMKQGRAISAYLAPDEVLLRETDILFAFEGHEIIIEVYRSAA
jgi:co-chaperonin GroES (HSP10)